MLESGRESCKQVFSPFLMIPFSGISPAFLPLFLSMIFCRGEEKSGMICRTAGKLIVVISPVPGRQDPTLPTNGSLPCPCCTMTWMNDGMFARAFYLSWREEAWCCLAPFFFLFFFDWTGCLSFVAALFFVLAMGGLRFWIDGLLLHTTLTLLIPIFFFSFIPLFTSSGRIVFLSFSPILPIAGRGCGGIEIDVSLLYFWLTSIIFDTCM